MTRPEPRTFGAQVVLHFHLEHSNTFDLSSLSSPSLVAQVSCRTRFSVHTGALLPLSSWSRDGRGKRLGDDVSRDPGPGSCRWWRSGPEDASVRVRACE